MSGLEDNTYAKMYEGKKRSWCVCTAMSYANTTSSVYPAGPISDNLSSEEPNCFHYYCMKPFTAHFTNCTY